MTRSHGLITFTERERIAGKDDFEDPQFYRSISRVRRRIDEEVVEEVDILREHHPDLLEELQGVVCDVE